MSQLFHSSFQKTKAELLKFVHTSLQEHDSFAVVRIKERYTDLQGISNFSMMDVIIYK